MRHGPIILVCLMIGGWPLHAEGLPLVPPTLPTVGDPAPSGEFVVAEGMGPGAMPGDHFWARAEYVFWETTGAHLPPLVTSAPGSTTNQPEAALGQSDTTLLLGNQRIENGFRSGFRLRAGFWLDDCHGCGLEASFFDLCPAGHGFQRSSDGSFFLARPAFNTITGLPGREIVGGDGDTGRIYVPARSSLGGGDINLRHRLCCDCGCPPCDVCGTSPTASRGYRVDLLTGYRINRLHDDLQINENINQFDLGGALAANYLVQDRFRTTNTFHGLQLGIDAERWCERWSFGVRALLALGLTHQVVDIEGATVITVPGAGSASYQGGFLALPTNIGHHARDPFTCAPELDLEIGYRITDHVRASIGYHIAYWSNVVRPGDQLDLTVNPRYIPPVDPTLPANPARPAFAFHGTDFWAHGLTAALEFRY